MTPEGKVKEKVKRLIKKYGAYYHMPVQNGMGAPTLDIIGCYYGQYFAVETKAPGKKMTARQHNTAVSMMAAGAEVFVISGDCSKLENWLISTALTQQALEGL